MASYIHCTTASRSKVYGMLITINIRLLQSRRGFFISESFNSDVELTCLLSAQPDPSFRGFTVYWFSLSAFFFNHASWNRTSIVRPLRGRKFMGMLITINIRLLQSRKGFFISENFNPDVAPTLSTVYCLLVFIGCSLPTAHCQLDFFGCLFTAYCLLVFIGCRLL
jgi:hypothetical protein